MAVASSEPSHSPQNRKRKRDSGAGPVEATSPSSAHSDHGSKRVDERATRSARRACNECRQQKLRCDVNLEPYTDCSRCRRLGLQCRVDANFHRVEKRNKQAEMEKELHQLRKQVSEQGHAANYHTPNSHADTPNQSTVMLLSADRGQISALHQGAADSLLELRNSSDSGGERGKVRRLDSIVLTPDQVDELFAQYFTYYHPLLPILDPELKPDQYFELSELLFWTVILTSARRYAEDPTLLAGLLPPVKSLIWSTLSAVPQSYHVVKALGLLCTWPMPTKSSSTDPTFMLAGIMMQLALQTGLHRPAHHQDFSKIPVNVREDEVQDRLRTWACCIVISQNVSTGFGQPVTTYESMYDYTLLQTKLPLDLAARVKVERFCNQVSRFLYLRTRDSSGVHDADREAFRHFSAEVARDLERQTEEDSNSSPIVSLQLSMAMLHLYLSVFFDDPVKSDYARNLMRLYQYAQAFLEKAFSLTIPGAPSTGSPHGLKYSSFYTIQMVLASGFTLSKLLNSPFQHLIDLDAGRRLFARTIGALRASSINNNDLPGRLAEVLAQLWRSFGAGVPRRWDRQESEWANMKIKVKSRMSMSMLYDSVWRWRKQFEYPTTDGVRNDKVIDLSNPTRIEAGTDDEARRSDAANATSNVHTNANASANTSTTNGPLLGTTSASGGAGMAATHPAGAGAYDELGNNHLGANAVGASTLDPTLTDASMGFDAFDPLTWMLDDGLEFPYVDTTLGLGMDGLSNDLGLVSPGVSLANPHPNSGAENGLMAQNGVNG